jgi:hypothetical protein
MKSKVVKSQAAVSLWQIEKIIAADFYSFDKNGT